MNKQKRKVLATRDRVIRRALAEVSAPRTYDSIEFHRKLKNAFVDVGLPTPVQASSVVRSRQGRAFTKMANKLFWSSRPCIKTGHLYGNNFDFKFPLALIAAGLRPRSPLGETKLVAYTSLIHKEYEATHGVDSLPDRSTT